MDDNFTKWVQARGLDKHFDGYVSALTNRAELEKSRQDRGGAGIEQREQIAAEKQVRDAKGTLKAMVIEQYKQENPKDGSDPDVQRVVAGKVLGEAEHIAQRTINARAFAGSMVVSGIVHDHSYGRPNDPKEAKRAIYENAQALDIDLNGVTTAKEVKAAVVGAAKRQTAITSGEIDAAIDSAVGKGLKLSPPQVVENVELPQSPKVNPVSDGVDKKTGPSRGR
jgi:hypothetical protein